MKKDWTEDIRKKMESYEHPAPEMVWSNVELPIIAKGKKESNGTKWKVAAAIIFLIGLTATLPLFTDQEQAEDKMSYDNTVSLNKDKETKDFDYRESYKTCLQWSPDSQYLFLTELQRNQQKYELKYFNAYSGKLEKILYTEENSHYVEPQHSPYFINNRQLLFQSRKDNFNHLYLLNIDGGALRQLTSGEWEVTDFIGRKNFSTHFSDVFM